MGILQLPTFDGVKILVVGEPVLDKYVWGTVERISPEAPVPVIRIREREARPGNAAFVCASLRSLGASVSLVSVVGADEEGLVLRQMKRYPEALRAFEAETLWLGSGRHARNAAAPSLG